MSTTPARKPATKPKSKATAKTERWKQFDPSWMWNRERPADADTRENYVLVCRDRYRS